MPAAQIAAPAARNITANSQTGDPLTTQFSDRGSQATADLVHRRTRRATRRHARSSPAPPSWRLGSPAHSSVLTVSQCVWGSLIVTDSAFAAARSAALLGHLETAAPAPGNEHAMQWGELSSPHCVIHLGERPARHGNV